MPQRLVDKKVEQTSVVTKRNFLIIHILLKFIMFVNYFITLCYTFQLDQTQICEQLSKTKSKSSPCI